MEQIIPLYGAVNGFFDKVPVDKIREIEEELMEHFKLQEEDFFTQLKESLDFSEENIERIKSAIGQFMDGKNYK